MVRMRRLKSEDVQIVKRFVLPGTIDGHKPIGVTFRIRGPRGWFRLTVVSVNWGRGYAPGEFKRNVMGVLDATDEAEYVVLLMQEIDEADAAEEHKVIREEMEPGTTLVEWFTREPIAVSPGVPVAHKRKVMTMDQGSAIGAPDGTGPRRFLVSCTGEFEGVVIWFGNQHPHRVSPAWSPRGKATVERARKRGQKVTKREVRRGARLAAMCVYGGDMNDPDYPKSHPREKVATKRGLDTIRYVVA